MREGDRFIYVGGPDHGQVGRSGTITDTWASGTRIGGTFDYAPHTSVMFLSDEVAAHGSIQIRGLSLSACVRDIILRHVNILDVGLITVGTDCRDEQEWAQRIEDYKRIYWRDFPDEAQEVVNLLLFSGKIEQPACHGGHLPDLSNGHWIAH